MPTEAEATLAQTEGQVAQDDPNQSKPKAKQEAPSVPAKPVGLDAYLEQMKSEMPVSTDIKPLQRATGICHDIYNVGRKRLVITGHRSN